MLDPESKNFKEEAGMASKRYEMTAEMSVLESGGLSLGPGEAPEEPRDVLVTLG